ncbi:hypothetical protein NVV94_16800 [Pseudomonas sp. LS1212]|uniref:hypothetical protein n=1 Tax=Pseudomonas sp. LS1212 TaxID=2972478 RepID=UPI00215C910D|nr:hypothetical protein [Pseudomonas sp. LS1212]UVJ42296.1 hypothetical protein NVV94_16800 [Pseudomonas sp. LS1212]
MLSILAYMPLGYGQDAQTLNTRYMALQEQLANSPFQRPLYLESREAENNLTGDIYALTEQPYAVVSSALQGIGQWCDILILHLNVKNCRASSKAEDTLSVDIGRKSEQSLSETYRFDFLYQIVATTPDYLRVMLSAPQGPIGTSDYRIELEVLGLDSQRSFLHLSYSYDYGMAARMAMQSYLATTGRNKVGFSIVGQAADGQPVYIRGMRGVVERNSMRYYLALEAYLGALSKPASEQLEKRLSDWYAGIERYPRQLQELERSEYLDMKYKEIQRQQEEDAAPTTQ